MEQISTRFPRTRVFAAVPWLALTVGLAVTAAAALYVRAASEAEERLHFQLEIQRTVDQIDDRLDAYIGALRAVAAWVATTDRADAAGFRAYVERLQLQVQYPGIQGVGFSRRVGRDEREALVATRRAEGRPDFRIWPEGERADYHTILYLEPLDKRNEAALGFDMFTEPVRRAAMERAARSHSAAASSKVTLVQEIDADKQPGFLIYVPVFRPTPDSSADSNANLTGFVYSPFRATDLFGAILATDPRLELDLAVFDGEAADPTALLHSVGSASSGAPSPLSARLDVAGRPWTLVFTPRAGAEVPAEAHFAPWLLASGTTLSLLLFGLSRAQVRAHATAHGALDDLRASEDHLRESESRYRYLFEGNPQPLWVYDTHTYEFLAVNAAAIRKYGYSREEFLRMRILDIRPAEEAERVKARLADLGPGLGTASEWRHRTKDGTIIDVEVVSHTVEFQGRAARLVAAFDITARKRAETEIWQAQQVLEQRVVERTAALEKSQRELAESQRELRDYVDHMSTLNAKVSVNGRLLLVNRVAQLASGLPNDQLIGAPFLDGAWFTFDPDVHARVAQAFGRAVAGESITYDEQIKIFGAVVYINFGLTPVFDAERQVQYILAEARDISAQKLAEQALRESTAQLEAANRELEAFCSSVSHDLRSPLTSIDGFSAALVADCAHLLNDDGRTYVDRIRRATGRMGQIIDDLLALSRVSRTDLQREPVDLSDLAVAVAEQLEQASGKRGLEFRATPGLVTIGDARLLRIALENLLGNAFKFTAQRERPLVEFDAEIIDSEMVFLVRDNGAGFDMRYAGKLFGAFQRLHDSRKFQGTGIGLATVKRIIERHGGRIWAEAEEERGATFRFTLPDV